MNEQLKPCPTYPACGRETSKMLGFDMYQCNNTKCIASCAPPQAAEMFSRPSPWVSVEERLPEIPGDYLCRLNFGQSHVLRFAESGWWYALVGNDKTEYVTHWMPLPQPPKGE